MECKDAQNKLSDYLDGYVTTEEKNKIDEHLLQCSLCMQEFDDMKSALQELRSLPLIEPPADFDEKLKARIALKDSTDEETAENLVTDKKGRRHNWSLWTAAAVLVFFVFGAGIYGIGFSPTISDIASKNDFQEERAGIEDEEKEEAMGIMEAPEKDTAEEPKDEEFSVMEEGVVDLEYKIVLDRNIEEAEKTFDHIQRTAAKYDPLDFIRDIHEESAVFKIKLSSKDVHGFLEEVENNFSFLEAEETYQKEEDETGDLTRVIFVIQK